jgi:tRNA(Ile)-lysidine synthase TilS/MesJ
MRKDSSLTLWILKSLYPRADLDAVDEGFVTTCTEEEDDKLVEDFVETDFSFYPCASS